MEPTYPKVTGLLRCHLSEAEGRHITPHAEGSSQASPCLTGAQEVSGKGEDPGVRVKVEGCVWAWQRPPNPRARRHLYVRLKWSQRSLVGVSV
jgi:hypothetical protein